MTLEMPRPKWAVRIDAAALSIPTGKLNTEALAQSIAPSPSNVIKFDPTRRRMPKDMPGWRGDTDEQEPDSTTPTNS